MDGKGYHIRVWITNIIFDDKLVFTYNYKKGIQTMSLAIVFAAFGSDSGAGRSPYRKPRSYAVNGLAARFFLLSINKNFLSGIPAGRRKNCLTAIF